MMEKAQIIFCPYNYIIDPAIRDAMCIQLNHTAIMIDEAHNVLDVARDAASCNINLNDFLMQTAAFVDYVKNLFSFKLSRDEQAFLASSSDFGVALFFLLHARFPSMPSPTRSSASSG